MLKRGRMEEWKAKLTIEGNQQWVIIIIQAVQKHLVFQKHQYLSLNQPTFCLIEVFCLSAAIQCLHAWAFYWRLSSSSSSLHWFLITTKLMTTSWPHSWLTFHTCLSYAQSSWNGTLFHCWCRAACCDSLLVGVRHSSDSTTVGGVGWRLFITHQSNAKMSHSLWERDQVRVQFERWPRLLANTFSFCCWQVQCSAVPMIGNKAGTITNSGHLLLSIGGVFERAHLGNVHIANQQRRV